MPRVVAKAKSANRRFPQPDGSASYRLVLSVTKDEEDCYSAVVLNLPGAGSCGDTEKEAVANAVEAARAVMLAYLERDGEIPWRKVSEKKTLRAIQKRVSLHA